MTRNEAMEYLHSFTEEDIEGMIESIDEQGNATLGFATYEEAVRFSEALEAIRDDNAPTPIRHNGKLN